MLFNSLDFLIFFPIVLIGLWIAPSKLRQLWLLACSYFFYMCWNPWCILLILFSTVVTFFCPIIMERVQQREKKLIIIGAGITVNLALLFYFKYFNFLRGTIGYILGRNFAPLDIILPVGISFYTFQALGYAIDCYRGTVKMEKNFIRYALFVAFFPQLVAGPIERSENLLGQLEELNRKPRKELYLPQNIQRGFIMMVWGMFLKTVIADRVAILVDNVYDNIYIYSSTGLIMAFLGFGLQIYCDFCSYSTIAIGAARIMGIELMENFNAPYLATSVSDFWRKWHISLSSWFKDYLYIPLGGNRKGKARKLINNMVVFLCSGLWHGASWTFVFWGAIHGFAVVIETLLRPLVKRADDYFEINKQAFSFVIVRAAIVTCFVDFAWVFFRADSFSLAFDFIKRMLTRPDWWVITDGTIYTYGLDVLEMNILVFATLMLMVVDFIRNRKGLPVDQWLCGEYAVFRVLFLILIIFMIVAFGEYGPGFDSKQFIYFQF